MDKKKDTPELSLFPELDPNSAILSSEDIRNMISQGWLIVSSTFNTRCLQSTCYDIRVGQKGIIGGEGSIIDLTKESLIIQPGSYAGVLSLEKIKLPNRVLAQIGSKRKLSYDGLILLTGAIVDPGYEGHLLFGLYNASTKKVVIPAQTKICNLTFILLNKNQEPVLSDPNLLVGDFPSDFVNNMANMEVMPLARKLHEMVIGQRPLTYEELNARRPVIKIGSLTGETSKQVLRTVSYEVSLPDSVTIVRHQAVANGSNIVTENGKMFLPFKEGSVNLSLTAITNELLVSTSKKLLTIH